MGRHRGGAGGRPLIHWVILETALLPACEGHGLRTDHRNADEAGVYGLLTRRIKTSLPPRRIGLATRVATSHLDVVRPTAGTRPRLDMESTGRCRFRRRARPPNY